MQSTEMEQKGKSRDANGSRQQNSLEWNSELCNPDELKIPNDNMLQTIRADQVKDGACGVSFCNSLLLRPKLRVQSEEHLALVVPGKLGQDLQSLLQESNPTLKSHAYECVLTLRDPVINRRFPRQVTIIN